MVGVSARAGGLGLVAALFVGSGCAKKAEPPKADIGEQFQAFVAERNTCRASSECVLAGGGCPLGCGAGVRAEHADEVDRKAQEPIAEHDKQDGACKYKCASIARN